MGDYGYFDSDIRHIKYIEDALKKKPRNKDLKETISICKDFGLIIKIEDIPELHSLAALEKWRTRQIVNYLDSQ